MNIVEVRTACPHFDLDELLLKLAMPMAEFNRGGFPVEGCTVEEDWEKFPPEDQFYLYWDRHTKCQVAFPYISEHDEEPGDEEDEDEPMDPNFYKGPFYGWLHTDKETVLWHDNRIPPKGQEWGPEWAGPFTADVSVGNASK